MKIRLSKILNSKVIIVDAYKKKVDVTYLK